MTISYSQYFMIFFQKKRWIAWRNLLNKCFVYLKEIWTISQFYESYIIHRQFEIQIISMKKQFDNRNSFWCWIRLEKKCGENLRDINSGWVRFKDAFCDEVRIMMNYYYLKQCHWCVELTQCNWIEKYHFTKLKLKNNTLALAAAPVFYISYHLLHCLASLLWN